MKSKNIVTGAFHVRVLENGYSSSRQIEGDKIPESKHTSVKIPQE